MPSISCDPAILGSEERASAMPEEAFEALFRAHFNFVYRNLARLGVPPGAVEDAAQEVFLVVLRRDVPVASMRGWLFGIVRRIAWRYRRGSARRVRLEEALTVTAPPPTDGAAAVAEREARVLLDGFLERLDEDKRVVFLLAELEQMTGPEIARALSVKENTVYSRLRAARQAFDRTFSRMRRAERRALGEGPDDDRSLRLSQARRAHEPKPATRQRAWIALFGAPGGAGAATSAGAGAGSGAGSEAPSVGSASGAGGAGAPAAIVAPKGGLAGSFGLAAASGAKVVWGSVAGLAAVFIIASAVPPGAGDPTAAAGLIAAEETPLASEPSSGGAEVDDEMVGGAIGELSTDLRRRRGDAGEQPVTPALDGDTEPKGPFAALARAQARRASSSSGRSSMSRDAPGASAAAGSSSSNEALHSSTDRTASAEDPPGRPGTVSAAPVEPDALAREVLLMSRAREELRARAWERAKILLERHARQFPDGALAEERRLSMVSVFCAIGDSGAARAEIERIKALDRGSSLAAKAVAMCPGLS